MSNSPDRLAQACTNLTNQFQHRYGARLFRSICGEPSAYATDLSACFKRASLTGVEISALQGWLVTGVKAFAEYPPSFEMMVQMGKLLKNFPITDVQRERGDFWVRLDTVFAQNYGRFWKTEGVIDQLQKERVWLCAIEECGATLVELEATLKKLRECVAFRNYPPNLEQFKDGLTAVRTGNAPLVEDAWLQAISMKPGQTLHPLVKKARGAIGAFDLNVGERDKAIEQRYKLVYLTLLRDPPKDMADEAVAPKPDAGKIEYVDTASILASL